MGTAFSLSLHSHFSLLCATGVRTDGALLQERITARPRRHRKLVHRPPTHTHSHTNTLKHSRARAPPCRRRSRRRRDPGDDAGEMEKLSASISELSWSAVSLPLDAVVGKFRLPTLVKLGAGRQTRS